MKNLLTSVFFFFCCLTILKAQQVQVNNENLIEIHAAEFKLNNGDKKELNNKLKAYDVFEIDLPTLRSQVLKNPNQANIKYKLPGFTDLEISIHEHDLRSDNYRSVAMTENGPVEMPKTACTTYKGYTNTNEDVRLSITENQTYGYITVKDEKIVVQSLYKLIPSAPKNLVAFYKLSDVISDPHTSCGNSEDEISATSNNSIGIEKSGVCHFVEFATDADFEQFTADGTVAATNASVLGEMNFSEGIFLENFDLRFLIVFQNVWTIMADPYTATSPSSAITLEVRTAWAAPPLSTVVRDYVIMFSGRNFGGLLGAVFSIGAMCNTPAESFAFVSIAAGVAVTTPHEIGHSMGGTHKAASWCLFGGTLMCATANNSSTNFSNKNKEKIQDHINDANCLQTNVYVGFEAGATAPWTQDVTDDLNWTLTSGATPSAGTGPSGAYQGNSYGFMEASGNPNSTAGLTSPQYWVCGPNYYLSFGYHMYGQSIGSLDVEISTNNGVSWNNVWSDSGNYGNTWKTAGIPLSDYYLQQIRFRIIGTTGLGFTSDIAIDDLAVGPQCPFDISSSLVQFSTLGGTQTINVSAGSTWEAHVYDLPSWITIDPIPFLNELGITVAPNNTGTVRTATIAISCGPTAQGITVSQSGFQNQPCIPDMDIPHTLNFETTSLKGWSQDPSDDMDFIRHSGATSSGGTGPTGAAQGNYYMYTEATNNFNKVANLVSPCFDLLGIPSPIITFSYNMHAIAPLQMGTLQLQLTTNNGTTWTTLFTQAGPQGQDWIDQNIDLSSYTTTPIRLRFKATTGNGYQSDIAIDDIQVKSAVCYDQYENNNTLSTAYSTSMGSFIVLSDACLGQLDDDYYRFASGTTNFYARVRGNNGATGDYRLEVKVIGETLTLETREQNGSTTDTYLYLYSESGMLIAADNNSGQGLFSKIVTGLPNSPGLAMDREKQTNTTSTPTFELRNYPNPFNQTTNFNFYLEKESTISLIISDIAGEVEAIPINDVRYDAGNHIFEFDASALSAGVYNYSLQTQNGTETKQMVIVR